MPLSFTPEQNTRLEQAEIIWLTSVRPNGAPHLVPLWFVWNDARAFICTPADSVKVRNIAANPRVAFALEDGMHPLICEGTAVHLTEIPAAVAELFQQKYDWEILTETGHVVIEITPTKLVIW